MHAPSIYSATVVLNAPSVFRRPPSIGDFQAAKSINTLRVYRYVRPTQPAAWTAQRADVAGCLLSILIVPAIASGIAVIKLTTVFCITVLNDASKTAAVNA